MFADRQDLYDSGLHGRTRAGIFGTKADDGAFSIVLNEGYEDDEDQGETIIYTGEGKGKPDEGQDTKSWKKQQADQDMNSPGNAALKRSVETGNLCASSYAPLQGYRYDGLYKVERVWSNPSTFFLDAESSRQAYIEEGKAGFKMCKFLLRVCFEVPRPLNSAVILTSPRSAKIPFSRPFPPTSQAKERQTNTGRQAASPRRSQCQISTNPRRRPPIPRRRPSRRRGRRLRAKNAYLPVSVSRRRPNECRAPDASFRCVFYYTTHGQSE
ncbi:PUA-like domain-containing protein [Mycena olivaceomarginata]|nr:PUA-like domain-containing protein [Mycena olivaceomarginata]